MKKVCVFVDDTRTSFDTLKWALNSFGFETEVVLLHARPLDSEFPKEAEAIFQKSIKLLRDLAKTISFRVIGLLSVQGGISTLLEKAEELGPDVIVVGQHKKTLFRPRHHTCDMIARNSSIPVIVVQSQKVVKDVNIK
ncbi:hypothetical protein HK103_000602 [Boothiomyces macroporosus]|uniref:UspA domain-containing protein n=1 Tax=Boothiomyces macroporosus TaxID=261099 RepID=A0AAD5Y7F8_9FUNG|nr:hypothetical protein HK103_000602 [Boothiomyces macroporosus]